MGQLPGVPILLRFLVCCELAAGELHHHEAPFAVLFFPPDQVMSKGRAVLSEIELQPDDFAVQLFQLRIRRLPEPMGLFADDFGWRPAEEGLAEQGFAGGFVAREFIGGEERGEAAEGEGGEEWSVMYGHDLNPKVGSGFRGFPRSQAPLGNARLGSSASRSKLEAELRDLCSQAELGNKTAGPKPIPV